MKILMIAPQPFLEPRGTPLAVLGRTRALSVLGHKVDLLTYHVGKDVVIPGIRIYRTHKIGFIKEVPVGPSWIKVLLDLLLAVKAFRMFFRERYDLVHTHEEASIFGAALAKVFSIRHLYDFHSSIPQVMRNFEYGRFTLFIRFLEWIERKVINSSNGIIVISPALAEYVRKIDDKIPVVTIENTVEKLDLKNIKEEDFREFKLAHYNLNGNKLVLYAGTFEPYQGIELLISSAKRVLQSRSDIIFVLVGGKSHQVEQCRELVSRLEISSHFYFTGIRPSEEIPLFMSIANVLVSPRISGKNVPLKIYGYLQSGKPIVATKNEAHTQVLKEETAVLVDPDPDSMAKGILSVLENPSYAKMIGEHARQFFRSHYSFQTYLDKTKQILEMVMN